MDLFKLEGNNVKPTEHALLVRPFSDIWHRDKDPEKTRAIAEFTFIELNCSYKKSNPFKGYPDGVREAEILSNLPVKIDIEDELVQEGIKMYDKLRLEASVTLQYYLSAKIGAEKTLQWLKEFDLDKRNERNGNLLYKPKEVTAALKDTFEVLKTLNAMENKVYEELYESAKTKGNKEINPFEM